MPPAGPSLVGRKLTKVFIKRVKQSAPYEWKLRGMWLSEEGSRVSLFDTDDLDSKIPDRESRLYKLLSNLWPNEDVDYIIVDQQSETCVRFRLQPVCGQTNSGTEVGPQIKTAIRDCGDYEPVLK